MRDGFLEITSGWTLITGIDDLTDRIERAAEWTKANGPLHPDEQATIKIMIEAQIARGMFPHEEPIPIKCDECDSYYHPISDSYTCPECGAENYPE